MICNLIGGNGYKASVLDDSHHIPMPAPACEKTANVLWLEHYTTIGDDMRNKILLTSMACLSLGILPAISAQAGEDAYIGEIFMTGANFCPRGTAALDGQLLVISQNTALFSLLGTMYGGDGRTSFGLPDMRGRSAIHSGSGPGLSDVKLGSKGGTENLNLRTSGQSRGKTDNGPNLASSEQSLNNRDPYLAIRYCIVLQGIYPSRN